ncbi:MAG TPA: Ig-like domain-containing protein [Clostridia bacterium]|nr:Ig-like domain-containing protein [Clostridia bacterium]
MKISLAIIPCLLLAAADPSAAQTADSYVAQGRAFLVSSNIVAANRCFSNAVAASPNHQAANTFYAVTRLLSWPYTPAGSNFLSRLGLPAAGRNLYNWTAVPSLDTNGLPAIPAGMNASEATAILRTNILQTLVAAQENLSRVTQSGFEVTLTAEETQTAGVTVDYADLQMFRAALHTAQYLCYTVYSVNLEVFLEDIKRMQEEGTLTIERVLQNHPQLLTFATTNDLEAAKEAFCRAAETYMQASALVRSRDTNLVRLINYDVSKELEEADFRRTLADLTNSITAAVPLGLDSNYVVFLSSHFAGTSTPRSFLPMVKDNSFGLGTLPDSTFGGSIHGLDPNGLDAGLAKILTPMPVLSSESTTGGISLYVGKGRGYVLQVSGDLLHWQDYFAFFALESRLVFHDPSAGNTQHRFYRLVDRTTNMPRPMNDDFAHRVQLSGLDLSVEGYTSNGSIEPDEQSWGMSSVWYSWMAPVSGSFVAGISRSVSPVQLTVYTGSSLANLEPIAWANQSFMATAGTIYYLQVTGNGSGSFEMYLTIPPGISVLSPRDGSEVTAPANIIINAIAEDRDGSLENVSVWCDGKRSHSGVSNSVLFAWTNVASGHHSIGVSATDNHGATTFSNLNIVVRPPNDNFEARLPLSGTSLTLCTGNHAATRQPGEPDHAGESGGASLWWTWTAPTNGWVTFSCWITNEWGWYDGAPLLAVYTGSSVSTLVAIASNAPSMMAIPAQVSFHAAAGMSYAVAIDSLWGYTWDLCLRITPSRAPFVTIDYPAHGSVVYGPTNLPLQASASDLDGIITNVAYYHQPYYGSQLRPISQTSVISWTGTWSNIIGGDYVLVARATDDHGISVYSPATYFSVEPFNDMFANRIRLVGGEVTVTNSSVWASKEAWEPMHAGQEGGSSLWWTWTSPDTRVYTILADIIPTWSYPALLGVYTGSSLSGLVCVASHTPAIGARAQVSLAATAGMTYQIAVDGLWGVSGDVVLAITQERPPSVSIIYPANDAVITAEFPTNVTLITMASDSDGFVSEVELFMPLWRSIARASTFPMITTLSNLPAGHYTAMAKATDNTGFFDYSAPSNFHIVVPRAVNDDFANTKIIAGQSVVLTGNNAAATREMDEPRHSDYGGGKSVWWTWVAPFDGTVYLTVDSVGAYAPVLAVYNGFALSQLSTVATSVGFGGTCQLIFTARKGSVYHLVLDDDYSQGGVYTLNLAPW